MPGEVKEQFAVFTSTLAWIKSTNVIIQLPYYTLSHYFSHPPTHILHVLFMADEVKKYAGMNQIHAFLTQLAYSFLTSPGINGAVCVSRRGKNG